MDKIARMDELDLLIIRAQAGDLDAFGMLVQRFQDMAVGYAYSILGDFHLAQDAAQEAFIEAYRNLGRVYGALVFPSWLRRIILKHCDRLARRVHIQTVRLEQAAKVRSEEKNPLEVAEEREMRQAVLSAIRSLPDEERIVTTLFYIDGYSYKEIAAFMEMPVTTVDNRLRSARKRLKRKMVATVRGALHTGQPSKDERFTNKVQLFNAAEVRDMDKVRELLKMDETHAALYDFLKARAEEQGMTIEELVVLVIQQYKEQIENHQQRTRIFRRKTRSREKQEALRAIEGIYNEAKFHNGAILEIARLVPKAEHNISVIAHIAYLASKCGHSTRSLVEVAQLASSCKHDCGELSDIADLIVMKLSGTMQVIRLAEWAVKAQTAEEKEQVRSRIKELEVTADYRNIEEALER